MGFELVGRWPWWPASLGNSLAKLFGLCDVHLARVMAGGWIPTLVPVWETLPELSFLFYRLGKLGIK